MSRKQNKKQKNKSKNDDMDEEIIEKKYAQIMKNIQEDDQQQQNVEEEVIVKETTNYFQEVDQDIKQQKQMDKQKQVKQQQKEELKKQKEEERKEQEKQDEQKSLSGEESEEDPWYVVYSDEEQEINDINKEKDLQNNIKDQVSNSNSGKKLEQQNNNKITNKQQTKTKVKQRGNQNSGYDSLQISAALILFILIMGFSKYMEEKYLKIKKLNFGQGEVSDLYSILEIDNSASLTEIKKQYKKLALIWHPDKNQNCGKVCNQKFLEIASAYEILGNEEKRKTYDQTYGFVNKIKSKAIQLTENNFEQLVIESNDIWIIMIYEDGDQFCEYMSRIWEGALDKYKNVVKFGRINKETAYQALQYIPVNIPIVPTILSFSNNEQSQIYTLDRRNPEQYQIALFRFIESSFNDHIQIFAQDNSNDIQNQVQQYRKDGKVSAILLTSINKIPIDYKYAAYKYQNQMEFFKNSYGSLSQVQSKFTNNTDVNLIFYYNDENDKSRQKLEFILEKQVWNGRRFREIIQLVKTIIIPSVDRGTFKNWCENIQLRDIENQNDKQILCIIIPDKKNDLLIKMVNKLNQEIFQNSLIKFNQNKDLFKEILNIQFIYIDFQYHFKASQLFNRIINDKLENKKLIISGLFPENRKISFLDNLNNFEDFIYDLIENEGNFLYLSEYLQEKEFPALLKFENESLIYNFIKCFKKNIKDSKMLIFSLILILSTWKYKKNFWFSIKFSFILCHLLSFGLTIIEQIDNILE